MWRVMALGVLQFVVAAMSILAGQSRAEGDVVNLSEHVIWAVNAGGDAHTDTHGIHFKKDPLEGKMGKGETSRMLSFINPHTLHDLLNKLKIHTLSVFLSFSLCFCLSLTHFSAVKYD